jgi:hypothetical protein
MRETPVVDKRAEYEQSQHDKGEPVRRTAY